jgi:hypothetical protein
LSLPAAGIKNVALLQIGGISMFWKSKKTSSIPKQALILKAYLSVSMALLSKRISNPIARAGLQVFILGMTDMIRQAERLDWEQFITIYEATLSEYELLPSMPIEAFVDRVGQISSSNADVEKVMRQGALSICMYVAERDANAPIDLIGVVDFAEKNVSSFTELKNGA